MHIDDIADPPDVRAIDLTAASSDLLAPCCADLRLVAGAGPASTAGPGRARRRGSVRPRREAGFFGRALVDGDAVLGWMQVAAVAPRAARRCLPAGPPSADAYLLTCSYLYDEEYLHGFRFLLQELEAELKRRKVAALEAFGLRRTRGDDALPRLPAASSTSSTRTCSRAAASGGCRRRARWCASASTSPRWSRRRVAAWRGSSVEAPAGAQPV